MTTTNECPTLLQLLDQDVFDSFFGTVVDTSANNMGGATELAVSTSPQEVGLELILTHSFYELTTTNIAIQNTSLC